MLPACFQLAEGVFPRVRAEAARGLVAQGWSQSKAAQALGVSQAMVSKYLSRPADDDAVVLRLAQDVLTQTRGESIPDTGCTTLRSLHDDAGNEAMADLLGAERLLMDEPPLHLLPQVGMNLARAMGDATTAAHILAYPARIVRDGRGLLAPRAPIPGGSNHLATCLLHLRATTPVTAMANVAGTPHVRDAALALGWDLRTLPAGSDVDARFAAAVQPGTKVYHDPGALGIEPCLYVAGASAHDVAHDILRLHEALS